MQYRTRREAAENGQAKYWTERPCKQGHITYRYTSTGSCAACRGNYRGLAQRRANEIAVERAMGKVSVSYIVHIDDKPALDKFVAALNLFR